VLVLGFSFLRKAVIADTRPTFLDGGALHNLRYERETKEVLQAKELHRKLATQPHKATHNHTKQH
jgi:hypothetical protein